jgi:nitrate/nitrite transport system substrate-binding protein
MGHRRPPLVVPWMLNRNGQGITLARDLAERVGSDPKACGPRRPRPGRAGRR